MAADIEFDLRWIVGFARRQFRLICLVFLAIVGISFIVLLNITPIFQANSLILFDPRQKSLLEPALQFSRIADENSRADSEVEIIASDQTLLKVIADLNLVSDPEYGVRLRLRDRIRSFLRMGEASLPTGSAALSLVVKNVRKAVTVRRKARTYLITVSARSRDPSRATDLANAVATAYIANQVSSKVADAVQSRDVIESRIQDAKTQIAASESAVDDLINTNLERIVAGSGRRDLIQSHRAILDLQASRMETSALANAIEEGIENGAWDEVAQRLGSRAIAELEAQRAALEQRIAAPEATEMDAQKIRAELDRVVSELRAETQSEIGGLRERIAAGEKQAIEQKATFRENVLRSDLPSDLLTDIYTRQQQSEISRNQYLSLLSRAQALDAEASLQMADSRIVSLALTPDEAVYPNIPLALFIAACAALVAAFAVGFMFENYVGGFIREDQVHTLTGQPIAAVVPKSDRRKGKFSIADMMIEYPLSQYAESIRRLRAIMGLRLRMSPLTGVPPTARVILVNSALPSEGKTTIALSIGRTYAEAHSRVLLIDCDLRRPSLHDHLGVDPGVGLRGYLTGHAGEQTKELLTKDPMSNLVVMLGSPSDGRPTDHFLLGEGFGILLDQLSQQFDYIILDSPPTEAVVDGLYLSQYAQLVVFVVRWAKTPQQIVLRSINSLTDSISEGASIVTVLNQHEQQSLGYGDNYDSYSK